jgi:tRNA pseudouridine13 synthase
MADETAEENPRKKIRLDESAGPTQRSENSAETDIEKEMRLGITSFTNRAIGGFSGILKQRYTDFLVNEILLSGKVLHLENIAGSEKDVETSVKIPSFSANLEPPITTPSAEETIEVASLPIQV